jgi:hypothetical protein
MLELKMRFTSKTKSGQCYLIVSIETLPNERKRKYEFIFFFFKEIPCHLSVSSTFSAGLRIAEFESESAVSVVGHA